MVCFKGLFCLFCFRCLTLWSWESFDFGLLTPLESDLGCGTSLAVKILEGMHSFCLCSSLNNHTVDRDSATRCFSWSWTLMFETSGKAKIETVTAKDDKRISSPCCCAHSCVCANVQWSSSVIHRPLGNCSAVQTCLHAHTKS